MTAARKKGVGIAAHFHGYKLTSILVASKPQHDFSLLRVGKTK